MFSYFHLSLFLNLVTTFFYFSLSSPLRNLKYRFSPGGEAYVFRWKSTAPSGESRSFTGGRAKVMTFHFALCPFMFSVSLSWHIKKAVPDADFLPASNTPLFRHQFFFSNYSKQQTGFSVRNPPEPIPAYIKTTHRFKKNHTADKPDCLVMQKSHCAFMQKTTSERRKNHIPPSANTPQTRNSE